MITNSDLEQSIINYYNFHKLEPLSLKQMLSQLNIPLNQGLPIYNKEKCWEISDWFINN